MGARVGIEVGARADVGRSRVVGGRHVSRVVGRAIAVTVHRTGRSRCRVEEGLGRAGGDHEQGKDELELLENEKESELVNNKKEKVEIIKKKGRNKKK